MKGPEQRKFESTSEALLDPNQLDLLAKKWNIPKEDILLIGLNASEVKYLNIVNERGRFIATFPDGREHTLALTISNKPFSPFEHDGKNLLFNKQVIAAASPITEDTCRDSYWRNGEQHLTLNSNSRSNCKGCVFCGTYSLENEDEALTNPDALKRKVESIQKESKKPISKLKSMGIVTGCFPNEKKLVEHLTMIREVFSQYGFNGEIQYIGSQLRSTEALQKIISMGPFALYLTVETFERRNELMRKTKASLDLEAGKKLLNKAKQLGAETCFLYIAGLDSCETIMTQFPTYKPVLTRLPQVQTFQAYVPDQIKFRNSKAKSIEYFLQVRKITEKSFPDFLPISHNNYRSLWYTTYDNQTLPKN